MSKTDTWNITFFQLEMTKRPLTSLHPWVVSVIFFKDAKFPLWPPSRRAQNSTRSSTRQTRERKKPRHTDDQPTVHHDHSENMPDATTSDNAEQDHDTDEGASQSSDGDGAVDMDEVESLLIRAEAMEELGPAVWEDPANIQQNVPAQSLAPAPLPPEEPQPALPEPGLPSASSTGRPIVDEVPQPPPEAPGPRQEALRLGPGTGTARGPTRQATIVVKTAHGTISFYEHLNSFEAVCNNSCHGTCKLRRSCKGSASRDGIHGGRPLGFMYMWFCSNHVDTKVEHWNRDVWATWTQEQRLAKRMELGLLANATDLLACERAQSEGEPAEPTALRGYMR